MKKSLSKAIIVVIPLGNVPHYAQTAFNESMVTGTQAKAEKYELPVIAPHTLAVMLNDAELQTKCFPVHVPQKHGMSIPQYLAEVKKIVDAEGFETVVYLNPPQHSAVIAEHSKKLGLRVDEFTITMWPVRYNFYQKNEPSLYEKVKHFFMKKTAQTHIVV